MLIMNPLNSSLVEISNGVKRANFWIKQKIYRASSSLPDPLRVGCLVCTGSCRCRLSDFRYSSSKLDKDHLNFKLKDSSFIVYFEQFSDFQQNLSTHPLLGPDWQREAFVDRNRPNLSHFCAHPRR
ncbi:hypothetical protein BpHYR1_037046 [Brachionus plicatilis]|uniref:Uncharacterized protein n=1 Tax=Brachionus plicatilis TaxID=10195 RepID=A0A3M7SMJ0_BRAPC|nr:hypothetical protein BpHYR1_037046 [Brachionus plicatilis]